MQLNELNAAWKSRPTHTAYEHALYILTWAAIKEADPEQTLNRLKKAFSPIVRPSKLAGNNYRPYYTLECLLYHALRGVKWYPCTFTEVPEELSAKIQALAAACQQQLLVEARMAKLSAKAA